MELSDAENAAASIIINKLKILEYPLLENGEWWLLNLLFTPGNHRLQLLDWMLSKFQNKRWNDIQLKDPDELSTSLLSSYCALGILQSADLDILLGETSKAVQLRFWQQVTKLLLERMKYFEEFSISSCSSEKENDDVLSKGSLNSLKDNLNDAYEKSCKMIATVASSVDIENLFCEKVDLFPADTKHDMKNMLIEWEKNDIMSLQDLKDLSTQGIGRGNLEKSVENPSLNDSGSLVSPDQIILLKKIEDAFDENRSIARDFESVYNNLKPVLRIQEAENNDIGESFENLQQKQKLLSEVFSNIQAAKLCHSTLEDDPSFNHRDILKDCNLTDIEFQQCNEIAHQSRMH